MIRTLLCNVLGHRWVKQSELEMSVGPRGKGTMIWEECSRCGETRSKFIADINFGLSLNKKPSTRKRLPLALVAEVDEDMIKDTKTDVTERIEDPIEPAKARAKKKASKTA